jgi:hypothetical protein
VIARRSIPLIALDFKEGLFGRPIIFVIRFRIIKCRPEGARCPRRRGWTIEIVDAGKRYASAEPKGTERSTGEVQIDIWPEPDRRIAPLHGVLKDRPWVSVANEATANIYDAMGLIFTWLVGVESARALEYISYTRLRELLHGGNSLGSVWWCQMAGMGCPISPRGTPTTCAATDVVNSNAGTNRGLIKLLPLDSMEDFAP